MQWNLSVHECYLINNVKDSILINTAIGTNFNKYNWWWNLVIYGTGIGSLKEACLCLNAFNEQINLLHLLMLQWTKLMLKSTKYMAVIITI